MLYRDSVWEVVESCHNLMKGDRFTIDVALTQVSRIVLEDGTRRQFPIRLFEKCRLISYRDCLPVYYLKQGDAYLQHYIDFGPRSNKTMQLVDFREVRLNTIKVIQDNQATGEPFTYEVYDPRTNIRESVEINPVWVRNITFLSKSFWFHEVQLLNLTYDAPLIKIAATISLVSTFLASVAIDQIGYVYILDDPDVIPLLTLQYGDDIRIVHNRGDNDLP